MNVDVVVPVSAGFAASLPCLWASLHLRRKQRLLHDLPTSKAHGVFIGLVELKGSAECEAPLTSHLAASPCVHYAWRVEEHWSRTVVETCTDKDGKRRTRTRRESGWTTVAQGGESTLFYLRDDTGAVRVDPRGAKIEPHTLFDRTVSRGEPLYYEKGPAGAVAHSDHRRRFVETGVPLHAPLYVVGQARERHDVVAPEIAADGNAAIFLISTRAEEHVQSGYAGWSWFWWAVGLAALGAGAWFSANTGDALLSTPHIAGLAAAGLGVYLLVWGACWVWMVYNSLVGLRERVRQGWSLIDVQLKRRNDLLPNLATAISGLSGHERETQRALAVLRAQRQATAPGVSGPDYDGVASELRAVVETYPQLVAQEGFAALQGELVSTEQRIALARSYYNDIATQWATRLERVPDRWVARLGSMRPEPLLAAAHFERAAVEVTFAR
ncbi:MAG TPA: LemA family protein [Opitutaceae bacterium]